MGFSGSGFGGYPKSSLGKALSNLAMAAATAGSATNAILVDSRGRVVVVRAGPLYVDFFPTAIPGAAGVLYQNTSGFDRILLGVRVLNITAAAVDLKLYLKSTALGFSNSFVWGAPGISLPAGGVWEWSGKWPVYSGQEIGGLAGAANSLYIHLDIQKGVDDLA